MQVYLATITRTVTRRIELPASDKAGAGRALRPFLRPGERIARIEPADAAGAELAEDGKAALSWLFSLPYLPTGLGGRSSLGHWVAIELHGMPFPAAMDPDRALSLAGLRWMEGGMLFIGSAVSIPALSDWCSGTIYEGPRLLDALGTLPGTMASAGALTLAGTRSRGIVLQAETVLETLKQIGSIQ